MRCTPMLSPKKDWQHEILHPDKTRQDEMPVNERPRVKAAEARRKAMKKDVDTSN